MYFLIDHENVKNNGYKGCECLLPEDTVEIFFSDSSRNIEKSLFFRMEQSSCEIKVCKLVHTRKNALDFYIACRVGELYGSGYSGNIAVISNDQDFKSVQDYWGKCVTTKKRIVLSHTIATAIVSTNEANERTRILREQLKTVALESEYARYEEKNRIRKVLAEQFKNTKYEENLDDIENVLVEKTSRKVVYLDSIKKFGKEDGIYIYNRIKELVG